MDIIKFIALVATFLGIVKYYPQYKQIKESNNVSSHSKSYIIIGLVTSLLWCFYNRMTTRDNIVLFSTIVGVVFQVYVLCKVLQYEKQKLKSI